MFACVFLVHPSGFEPETVRVGGENSIQLNYGCIGIPFVITNYFCGNKSFFANTINDVLAVLRFECLLKRAKKPPFRYLVIMIGIPTLS